jgi:hypothetical protein
MSGNVFYGWFDEGETEPTYDPPRGAPCPFCGFGIGKDDVRTHNLLYADGITAKDDGEIVAVQKPYAARSYFYRTHRTCAETDPTHTAMDDFILDMIRRNGD